MENGSKAAGIPLSGSFTRNRLQGIDTPRAAPLTVLFDCALVADYLRFVGTFTVHCRQIGSASLDGCLCSTA